MQKYKYIRIHYDRWKQIVKNLTVKNIIPFAHQKNNLLQLGLQTKNENSINMDMKVLDAHRC